MAAPSVHLRILHTQRTGTVLTGTQPRDRAGAVLRAKRWVWSTSATVWLLPNSRNTIAPAAKIEATAEALRAAGFVVEVDVCDQPRSLAELEAEKTAREDFRTGVRSGWFAEAPAPSPRSHARNAAQNTAEGDSRLKAVTLRIRRANRLLNGYTTTTSTDSYGSRVRRTVPPAAGLRRARLQAVLAALETELHSLRGDTDTPS